MVVVVVVVIVVVAAVVVECYCIFIKITVVVPKGWPPCSSK